MPWDGSREDGSSGPALNNKEVRNIVIQPDSQPGPTSTHGAALALLHNPLAVRTVQLRTERLLVGALHVAVRTLAEVAPLGTPDLAVGQHWGQVVQGSAGLCNVKELLRSTLQYSAVQGGESLAESCHLFCWRLF